MDVNHVLVWFFPPHAKYECIFFPLFPILWNMLIHGGLAVTVLQTYAQQSLCCIQMQVAPLLKETLKCKGKVFSVVN
jgi:hypothetical protein